MLIGIEVVKEMAEKLDLSVAEVVYGQEHVKEHHKNAEDGYFYKPRYLKSCDYETGKMYAFPNGLPGLNKQTKIHLIGHSMGALTARHF